MKIPAKPANESKRLASLKEYNILDTLEEEAFDDITQLASQICGTPISLVTFVDKDRQWFKSRHGLEVTETPRDHSYCAHAINEPAKILEVQDATKDERFIDNPYLTGEPYVRFYVGIPLVNSQGYALGTLCVIDHKPNKISEDQRRALMSLARQVMAQLELKRRQQELDFISFSFQNSPVGMAWVNEAAEIVKFNDRYCSLTGLCAETLQEKKVYEFDMSLDEKGWAKHWNYMLRKKKMTIETTFSAEKGKKRHVELKLMLQAYDGTEYIHAICTDISDRKNAERRSKKSYTLLEESEKKWQRSAQLLERVQGIAKIGHWELKLPSNEVYWSNETRRIHEIEDGQYKPTLEEAIKFYDDTSRPVITAAVEKAIATAGTWDLKLGIITAKGNKKWVRAVGQAYQEDGKTVLLYGVFQDIDKETRLREEIVRSEELFRLVSENIYDFVAIHDLDGIYSYASPAVTRMLGYTAAELIGQNPYDYVHPEDVKDVTISMDDPLWTDGKYPKLEYRIKKKDGEYVWVETLLKLMKKKGKNSFILTSTRDITERKENEATILKNNKYLQIAKDRAEAASVAKENFLSSMSHEIRTPLNAIIGITHILQQEDPREDQLANLDLVKFSSEHLLALINDILDYNKMDANKLILDNQEFSLKNIMVSIKGSQEFKVKEKGIKFKLYYDDDIPEVLVGDSVRIAQIINNLVSNAIKFTEKGGIKVFVEAIDVNDQTAIVEIAVEDSGIGIAKDKQGTIFERFTQAESNTTRKFGGSGLGLSITKKLLELMGSEISLDSEPDKGSRFSFRLKLQVGSSKRGTLLHRESTHKQEDLSQYGVHLLVVEDNKANQVVAQKFLNKWGVQVSFADNGKIALEKVAKEKYDLVLMDLQMPEMDGFTATEQIRAMEGEYFRKVPILALSAAVMEDIKQKAKQAGINDYITKPFIPHELYNKVVKWMDLAGVMNNGKTSQPNHPDQAAPKADLSFSDRLLEYTQEDVEFAKQLAKLFINNFIELKNAIPKSILERDIETIKNLAHKMKFTLDTLQAKQITGMLDKGKDLANGKITQSTLGGMSDDFKKACEEAIKKLEEV